MTQRKTKEPHKINIMDLLVMMILFSMQSMLTSKLRKLSPNVATCDTQ